MDTTLSPVPHDVQTSPSDIEYGESTGTLLFELNANDIEPSARCARMSDFSQVASYNWMNNSAPTILIPGSPARWSPPTYTRRLSQDEGEVFIDQNAARYPNSPLEPMFRAIFELHHDFNLKIIDVVIDQNSLNKLYEFTMMNHQRAFEIDVEIIGHMIVFMRKEKQATEIISEFRGFGHTFPEEYTSWNSEVKGSSSHHRIAQFDFAGLKYLIRFESDGYLPDKAEDGRETSETLPKDETKSERPSDILSPGATLGIGEKQPLIDDKLAIHHRGTKIDQDAVLEIKTRASHKLLDMESVLPRLWMSQTKNLIAAYHRGGRFDNVQIVDMHERILHWENCHEEDLKRLDTVMRRVIDTVTGTTSKKCRISSKADSGNLEIRELGGAHPCVLPNDLVLRMTRSDDDDDEIHGLETGRTFDVGDDDDGYDFSGHGYDSDGSAKDFMACSSEDCGYCGHCRY